MIDWIQSIVSTDVITGYVVAKVLIAGQFYTLTTGFTAEELRKLEEIRNLCTTIKDLPGMAGFMTPTTPWGEILESRNKTLNQLSEASRSLNTRIGNAQAGREDECVSLDALKTHLDRLIDLRDKIMSFGQIAELRHNSFSDGRVMSIGLQLNGQEKTSMSAGIALAGKHTFGPLKRSETILVIEGSMIINGKAYSRYSDEAFFAKPGDMVVFEVENFAVYYCKFPDFIPK